MSNSEYLINLKHWLMTFSKLNKFNNFKYNALKLLLKMDLKDGIEFLKEIDDIDKNIFPFISHHKINIKNDIIVYCLNNFIFTIDDEYAFLNYVKMYLKYNEKFSYFIKINLFTILDLKKYPISWLICEFIFENRLKFESDNLKYLHIWIQENPLIIINNNEYSSKISIYQDDENVHNGYFKNDILKNILILYNNFYFYSTNKEKSQISLINFLNNEIKFRILNDKWILYLDKDKNFIMNLNKLFYCINNFYNSIDEENKKNLIERINNELFDTEFICSYGVMCRLINSLIGLYTKIYICISNYDYIKEKFLHWLKINTDEELIHNMIDAKKYGHFYNFLQNNIYKLNIFKDEKNILIKIINNLFPNLYFTF